jgi:hypothetical protein
VICSVPAGSRRGVAVTGEATGIAGVRSPKGGTTVATPPAAVAPLAMA